MKQQRRFRSLWMTAAAAAALVIATASGATVINYTSQPGALAPDDRPLGATAEFTFDGLCTSNCQLIIELANTEPMTGISQGLTDFHFTSTSMTGLTLTGADGDKWINCYHNGVNKPNEFCDAPTDAAFDANSYGWTLTGSYVLAATPLPDSGIITTPIDPNSDGVSNQSHNPWLIGPVDFFFTYSGLFSVGNVAFSFGTDASDPTVPACTTNCCDNDCGDTNVPEPSPLALLAVGMIALVTTRRRLQVRA